MSIQQVLEKVKTITDSWGELLEPPATNIEIGKIVTDVYSTYGVKLPDEYVHFLSVVDGLEFNGFIIYGTKDSESIEASALDIMEINNVLKDISLPDVIFIGESSTGLITYNGCLNQYQYRDRIGIDRIELYSSFEQMLSVEVNKVQ